jgi:hypothetical protein
VVTAGPGVDDVSRRRLFAAAIDYVLFASRVFVLGA